ncbi:MAG: VIT domain-containing protein, partial [Flavobacteriales bacterium]
MKTNTLLLTIAAVFMLAAMAVSNTFQKKEKVNQSVAGRNLFDDSTALYKVLPTAFPALLVKKSKNDTVSQPLKLRELKVDVQVVGNRAQTTMDMVFYNDLNRVLEGEFVFPLGEGQLISGYSLEIEGHMRKAVVVEKAKGQQVFESVIRQGIDPGLLEWTKGNNFRTRIFPIPAKGTKRISVTVEQEIISAPDEYRYMLPMLFKDAIDKFELKASVNGGHKKPYRGKLAGKEFEFVDENNVWKTQFETTNFIPNAPVQFSIPKKENKSQLLVQPTGSTGDSYFYYLCDPQFQTRDKKLPSSICLLWDVSGSGANRNLTKEIKVLENYIVRIGNVGVKVVCFNNEVSEEKNFVIADGNAAELKKHLENCTYDGGTQLGALDLSKYTCDEFILCSDGISTFGSDAIKKTKTPVIAISSSQQADYGNLTVIANTTGGRYINLATWSESEGLDMLTSQSYRFLNAEIVSGKVTEVYPSIPVDVTRTFSIAGMTEGGGAEMVLNFGFGNEVVHSQRIQIKAGVSQQAAVDRLWAQKKINSLDLEFTENEAAITKTAKEFSIVTRYTSLIVLDRLEDYVTHRIFPPEKEMQKEYLANVKKEEAETQKTKMAHLDEVVTLFTNRKTWWETEFKIKPKTNPKLQSDTIRNTGQDGQGIRTDSISQLDLIRFVAPVANITVNGSADIAGYVNTIPGVVSGSYTTTVTDANGATASGGTSAYSYSWSANESELTDRVEAGNVQLAKQKEREVGIQLKE